jgi:hypothetical protein
MGHLHSRFACAIALLGAFALPALAQDGGGEFPLARSKLSLRDTTQPEGRRIVLKARWKGQATFVDPAFAGSTLRVSGTGPTDGDSGLIQLAPSHWHGLGKPAGSKGYRYDDPTGAAGGITRLILKQGKNGGVFKVVGGRANWRYAIGGPQNGVNVSFKLGDSRWCAEFRSFGRNVARRVQARSASGPASCPCQTFESTFAAIQNVIFQGRGCTENVCHGSSAQGGLDLRPDVAYDNLVDVFSLFGQMDLVEPGEQARSFLWRKLAKATLGLEPVPGTAMPNGLPPIPENELEALRQWIRAGAPRTGVVPNTEQLLGSCLPPPDPIKIRRPDPPPAGTGVQLHAPPWEIAAKGEDEVCYATWYDFSAQVPESAKAPCPDFWGGPSKTCFFVNRTELTQDPNSHHSIIHIYKGAYDITDDVSRCRGGTQNRETCNPAGVGPAPDGPDCDGGTCEVAGPAFGPFTCRGGALHGQPCDPKADACGADSACAGRVQSTIACVLYGPPDYGFNLAGAGTNNAPTVGGSQQPFSVTQFPPQVFSMWPVSGTMVWNSHAFNLTDQATTNEQYFNIYFAGENDRTYPAQAIFDSNDIFVQNVPPFEQREYCRTFTLPKGARLYQFSSHTHKRASLFRIWGPGITDRCGSEDPIKPEDCPPGPDGQQIFTTTDYSDPMQLTFDPPLEFTLDDESSRTFKFCALYDNGFTDPMHVKRRSLTPAPPLPIPLGGPCRDNVVACLSGPKKGQLCGGNDRFCDTDAQTPDGVCDACPLTGGVTTEDEMFILLGGFYVVP